MFILNAGQIASFVILYLFPSNHTVFLLGMHALIGFTNPVGNISYGIMCDAIDYGEYKYGVREEALSSSFMSFGVKLATAITGSVGVLLLAATGYVPNAEQTASAVNGINLIVNLFPALITVIAMIPMLWYKLDNQTMAEVQDELRRRRAAESKL